MHKSATELVVNWYEELESRLKEILKTTLYNTKSRGLFIPPLANIILDSCSLIDTVLREEYKGPKKRGDLNIPDYCLHFEPILKLSKVKTILYQYPLSYITPFKGWYGAKTKQYRSLDWWQSYNYLKHDRIRDFKKATLKNAVFSVCALHQIMSQMETFIGALIRHDLACFGHWDMKYAKDAVFQPDNKDLTILIETELFATPLGVESFPQDISKISPFKYSYGKRLPKYVGRYF